MSPSQKKASSARIVQDFGHKADDADMWLSRVRYNCVEGVSQGIGEAPFSIDPNHYEKSLQIMKGVGLVPEG